MLPLSDNGNETFPRSYNNFDGSVKSNASDTRVWSDESVA